MNDVAAIRERHRPETRSVDSSWARYTGEVCSFDQQPWPCDVVTVLGFRDECERQFQEKAALLAATPSAEPAGRISIHNLRFVVSMMQGEMSGYSKERRLGWEEALASVLANAERLSVDALLPTQASDSKETT